jgi:predicted ATPase/class 3 adenylate cyclase
VQIGLLGPLVVETDAGPVQITAGKERTVLAWLALRHGHAVTTGEFLDVVWGDAPPPSAPKAVQTYIHNLRRFLPADSIQTVPGGYTLCISGDDVDVVRFEVLVREGRAHLRDRRAHAAVDALRAGLALWRGTTVAELGETGAALGALARLHELRNVAVEDLADARAMQGDHDDLAADLEAAVAEEPLRERRWSQLMRTLARSGRHADALRAYQRFRRLLGEELGIEPSADLTALEQSILLGRIDGITAGDASPTGRGRPTGTVTFLFTDIEASTVLWDRFPRLMGKALAQHDAVLERAIEERGGFMFAAGGDGFGAAFASASDAAAAAVDGQLAVACERWPAETVTIRVRMGLHTGIAEERGGNYFGATVNRAARIADSARGGQIVMSAVTASLLADERWTLVGLGSHRLEGFGRPEQLYRLHAEGVVDVDLPLRSGHIEPGNLPHHRATLIGREQELVDLDGLLLPGALVTVTGVGGVGKTRLALAAATAAVDRFGDGAWLVELGRVVAPEDVASAVATSLGVQPSAGVDMVAALAGALESQRRLLVLDNCEHVIDVVAELVDAIGARCPTVTVIATSREALGLAGERIFPVRPLAVDSDTSPSAAARLFTERAAGVIGRFDPGPDEQVIIDNICRRLDGLPLAIELAAVRLPVMSLAELDDRLQDRFRLLTRRRGAVERHQSLRTTVAWSYDLLTPNEQLLFDRLSVFAGGFDLHAAEAVAGGSPLVGFVEDLLVSLVDKSLATASRGPLGTRYQQLETLRQFGEERLEARGETIEVRRRHLDHFLEWAARADASLKSADELPWHHAFAAEWHNLRNAFGWANELDDGDAAARLVGRILWWGVTRVRVETADWLDTVLTLPSAADHPLRPMIAAGASAFALLMGDRERTDTLLELARIEEDRLGTCPEPWVPAIANFTGTSPVVQLAGARQVQRRAAETSDNFWTLVGVVQEAGTLAWMISSYKPSLQETASHLGRIREVAAIADRYGNPAGIAHACMALGGALCESDPTEALRLLERAVDLSAALDIELTTNQARRFLAEHYTSLGRPHDALALTGPTIQRHVRSGAQGQTWLAVTSSLRALVALGRPELAVTVLGALSQEPDSELIADENAFPVLEVELRAQLGSTEVDRLLEDGKHLTIAEVAPLVLQAIDELLV